MQGIPLYRSREETFSQHEEDERRRALITGNIRLAVFVLTLAGFLAFLYHEWIIAAVGFLLLGTGFFIHLILRHGRILLRRDRAARLRAINADAAERLAGKWTHFSPDGSEYRDEKHTYASDIDIFGPASLFQWVCVARTRLGRLLLRDMLASTPPAPHVILENQECIRDLAPRLEWRQRFECAGRLIPRKGDHPEELLEFAESDATFYPKRFAQAMRYIPLVTFPAGLYLLFVFGTYGPLVLILLLHVLIGSLIFRRNEKLMDAISRQRDNFASYIELISLVEEEEFTAAHLSGLRGRYLNPQGESASSAIRNLRSIADFLDARHGPVVHLLANGLCLWDLQGLLRFQAWRGRNGKQVRAWLEGLARLEALSGFAGAYYDHSNWCFPVLSEGEPLIDSKGMGHPLILEEARVDNDLSLEKKGEVLIITGSNMSGKSTLLRTIGINLVLAYAGAPVCASSFRAGLFELHSAMRIKDDLENHVSTFYAELLRIKGVLESAQAGRPVFFLLDEIFRGTNSHDRHVGARTVLRQLSRLGASGLVSTHDLELGDLEKESPEVFRNFHFREHYEGDQIRFDFRLRPGISQTTNASHLMRMVGIEIPDSQIP